MVMVLWQGCRWLGWLCLNVAIVLVVDSVFRQVRFMMLLWLGNRSGNNCDRCFRLGFRELLLHLQVRVNGVHTEIEIGAVLLIVLGADMWTSFFRWTENVARDAALNGHKALDENVITCRHAKALNLDHHTRTKFSSFHFLFRFCYRFSAKFSIHKNLRTLTGGRRTLDEERASDNPMLNSVELILMVY